MHGYSRAIGQAVAAPVVGGELPIGEHAAACGLDVGFTEAGGLGDGAGTGAGVGAEVPEDGGARVGGLVFVGGAVEQGPYAGRGVEGQGVFVLVYVAAGDLENTVGLAPGALEDERRVRCSGDAVGAGDLGQEVLGACFADVVDEHERPGRVLPHACGGSLSSAGEASVGGYGGAN
jgi:hypothetical protein